MITSAPNYTRRKWVDRFMRGLTVGATLLAMVPLFLILGYVFYRGIQTWNVAFFTQAYEPPVVSTTGEVTSTGGVLHGIVGTFMIVGTALLMALPIGILAGVFLAEFPSNTFANVVRFCTDVLSAAPSIIVGIVAYVLIVQRTKTFSGWAGSVALVVLMIPIVTRTTEEILKLVPQTMREAALALGAPNWWLTASVVVPAALSGIATGVLLAFARGAGETAPLLLTVLGNNEVSFNMFEPMSALPLLVYKYTDSPYPAQNDLAWGAALLLTVLVVGVNLAVRLATRKKM